MRKWTLSACVVLAWCILPLAAVIGSRVSGPLQATTTTAATSTVITIDTTTGNTAGTTPVTLTAHTAPASPARPASAVRPATPARPTTWTVRPGDTLTGIAAAFGLHGGWQTLYATNRHAIGTNPDLIRPGTVLALPAAAAAARYTIAPGDTLSALAAALAIPGGWQALYAANRHAIGPDPNTIRPGTVLATPPQAASGARAQALAPARPGHESPGTPQTKPAQAPGSAQTPGTAQAPGSAQVPGTAQARTGRFTAPGNLTAPAGGMPRWLLDILIAAGVLVATAFAAEPAAALARRRRAAGPTKPTRPVRPAKHRGAARATEAAALAAKAAAKAKIILAKHERLIVTYSIRDHTVYVLTPPGQDPMTVLAAARLVLPEDTYQDLAGHLGVTSTWPFE